MTSKLGDFDKSVNSTKSEPISPASIWDCGHPEHSRDWRKGGCPDPKCWRHPVDTGVKEV